MLIGGGYGASLGPGERRDETDREREGQGLRDQLRVRKRGETVRERERERERERGAERDGERQMERDQQREDSVREWKNLNM